MSAKDGELSGPMLLVNGAIAPAGWVAACSDARSDEVLRQGVLGLRALPFHLPFPIDGTGAIDGSAVETAAEALVRSFAPAIPAGCVRALRDIRDAGRDVGARWDDGARWLLRPVHLLLTRDHVRLDDRGCDDLGIEDARTLIESIAPLLADFGWSCEAATALCWAARQTGDAWSLHTASRDIAAGRAVDTYLPTGDDARAWRRLLNEIQMTWFDHPVNRARESRGVPPVNGLWLNGPIETTARQQLDALFDAGLRIDESLVHARLRDDIDGWRDTLLAMLSRLPAEGRVFLAGDEDPLDLRELVRSRASRSAGIRGGLVERIAKLRSRLRGARPSHGTGNRAASTRGSAGGAAPTIPSLDSNWSMFLSHRVSTS